MQMFTTRVLFAGLVLHDTHSHIDKLRMVCKSFLVQPDWDMDVVGQRVLPHSLIGDAVIWFNELLKI